MYTPGPTKDELKKMELFGLTPEDYAGEAVEVFPENERIYFLFSAMQTQWRVGVAGPSGLDYNVLFAKMDRMRLEPDDYDELEDDIRVMEYAALGAMNERE